MLQTICALCPNLCYTRKYSALCSNLCCKTKHLLSEHIRHTKIWCIATQSAQAVASSLSLSLPAYLNDPNLCSKRNSFVSELMLHTKIWCITAQLMLQTICTLCPNLCYTRKYSALCSNLCCKTKHLLSEHMLHTKIWWSATQSAQAVASSRSLSLSLPT